MKEEEKCENRIDEALADRLEDFKEGELEGLCFNYVEPNTFDDQPQGFYRWQISWGGPSDEFRLLPSGKVEYWFLDWFDGASREVYDFELIDYLREQARLLH